MLMLISLQLGEAGTNMCCPELVPQITEKTRWQTNQCIWVSLCRTGKMAV